MNKLTSLLTAVALTAVSSAPAAPFLAIGDSAELFLTGSVGLKFDDNVTLSPTKLDDVIFEVVPGFSLEFGKNAMTSGSFAYYETITRYSDASSLDAELSTVSFNSNYDNGKSTFGVNASYAQLNQNTPDIQNPDAGQLSRRDVVTLGAKGEFEVSEKSSIAAGVAYDDTDYASNAFTDSQVTTVPLTYYFEVTPKVDASAGFRYRSTQLSGTAIDSEDFFYTVGARGDFTPKLSGSFSIGAGERNLDVGDSESIFAMDSSFDYMYSEKTSFNLTLSNDFGVSGQGESQENTSFGLGATVQLRPELSMNGRFTYRKIAYFGRDADDYLEFTLSGDYTLNEYVTFSGRAEFRDNKSGLGASGDFDNTVFAFTARLRY